MKARWLEMRRCCEAMNGGGDGVESDDLAFATDRLFPYAFRLGRGWRFKFGVLKQKWVFSVDRMNLPLPKGLHFLYAFIRPPLWLWRRIDLAPAGCAGAWRRGGGCLTSKGSNEGSGTCIPSSPWSSSSWLSQPAARPPAPWRRGSCGSAAFPSWPLAVWRMAPLGSSEGGGVSRSAFCWPRPPLVLLQLIPLPPATWETLPGRQTVVKGYTAVGMAAPWLPVSLTPNATWDAGLGLVIPPAAMFPAPCSRLGLKRSAPWRRRF